MRLEVDVSSDGELRAKLPARYHGRHVSIVVEDDEERAHTQWNAICAVLDEIETQDIPRRSHQEILESLRQFRESE